MKQIKMLIAAVTICGLIACADNTPRQLGGIVVDATMNNVVVKDSVSGETYDFSIVDADKSESIGMLIGSPIRVDYVGALKSGMAATKIATDATYNEAVGSWIMPDPIDSMKVMGVELEVEGAAKSINMATLVYTGWELQGEANKILLKGQSIGNGQTIDFTEVALISKSDEGKMILTIDGTATVYTKQE